MRAEGWVTEELELEGWPVTVTSYRIASSFLTEVESGCSGSILARGIGSTREESRREAFETASRRLLHSRFSDLTVGG